MLSRMQSVLQCPLASDIVAVRHHVYVSDISSVYEITNGELKVLAKYEGSIPCYRSDINLAYSNPTYIMPPAAWEDFCVIPHRNENGETGFAGLKCFKNGIEYWGDVRSGISCGAVSVSEQGTIHWFISEKNKIIDVGMDTDGQSLWQTELDLRGTQYICQPLKRSVLVIVRDEKNLGVVQLVEVIDNGQVVEHSPINLKAENLNYKIYTQANEKGVFISVCFCPDLICVIPYNANGCLEQKMQCMPMTAPLTELSKVKLYDVAHGHGPLVSCRLGLSGNDYVLQKRRLGPPGTGQILERVVIDADGVRTVCELFSDVRNPQRLSFQGKVPVITKSGAVVTLFEVPSQLGIYQNGTWEFKKIGEVHSLVCHADTIYLTEGKNNFSRISTLRLRAGEDKGEIEDGSSVLTKTKKGDDISSNSEMSK